MPKKSAGILLYRIEDNLTELLLAHPGGPFWAGKDLGAWSVPKGELTDGEAPLEAARREFEEETGVAVSGDFTDLGTVKQKSGKTVYCFALRGNLDPALLHSNFFDMEWPPKSGRVLQFPEIDRFEWFAAEAAKAKINPYQAPFIDVLLQKLETGKVSDF